MSGAGALKGPQSIQEALTIVAGTPAVVASIMCTLPAESLERTGTHDEAGEIQAGDLVHYWAVHDLVHLRQLLSALQSRMEPHIGNMHVFLEEV